MPDLNELRAEFEAWFSDDCKSPLAVERNSGGTYKLMQAQSAWIVWQAARRQHGSAVQAVEPKRRDIFAICDAYESGIGHGLQRDGHKSGAIFGNPECGMAYEIGYEEGEERASGKKPNAPPVAAEQPAAAGNALTDSAIIGVGATTGVFAPIPNVIAFGRSIEQHLRAAPQAAPTQELVRFCPHCGLIGEVEDEYRDCCPDGDGAYMVPSKFAEQCHATFRLCLETATAPQAAQGNGLTIDTPQFRVLVSSVAWESRTAPSDAFEAALNRLIAHIDQTIAAHTRASDGEDSERLDFLATNEAWIAWTKDGESCRVFHRNEDGDCEPIMGWVPEAWAHSPREAIDAAMQQAASNQQEGA